jgi:uncharacterized membrane protein YphA (DoxX/SURF4 family)
MTRTIDYQTPGARPSGKAAVWAGWIIGILPCLALLLSAFMKFAKPPAVVQGFTKFGYPERLLLVLGIVELTCTILYLIPRTAFLGAILLTGYLGGATATHVRVSDPSFVTPVVCGILVWLGLFLRDRRVRALVPLRS